MRIWIKALIGITAGLITGIIIPYESAAGITTLEFLSTLAINIGRYMFFPLIFFSLTLMVFELNRNKLLLRTIIHTLWLIVVTSLVFSAIGTLSALALKQEAIPILTQTMESFDFPNIKEIFLTTFPRNSFKIFSVSENFIFPLVVFALFFGWALSYDTISTRPAVDLFDSLSKTFSFMNRIIIEISGLLLFFIAAYLVLNLKTKDDIHLFTSYLLFLSLVSAVLIFLIYPLLVFAITKNKRPYKFLFGILTPSLVAFISGDVYFSLSLQIRHNEKNLGVNERINTLTTAFLAVLGRAGTALVTSSSFILVLKAYSSTLNFSSIITIIFLSFIISFVAGSTPGAGVIISLAMIATIFKKSTTDSHLLIMQVAPLMLAFSALLDTINASFISLVTDYIINKKDLDKKPNIPIKRFI